MMQGTIYLILASALWGLLHSLSASRLAKDTIRNLVGAPAFDRLYRFSFNFFSLASFYPVLAMLLTFPDRTLYSIPAPWVYLSTVIQGLCLIVMMATLVQTDPFEFVGLKQLAELQPGKGPALVTDGWYAFVRHPLYLAFLGLIWLVPLMTVNRLAVFAVLSLYTLIGAFFEERKLLQEYGAPYADYQARVPMLLPRIPASKS